MGVREFNAWCTETQRASQRSSSPERWDGEDRWFDEQHRRHQAGQGRG
jgi:hypothetical protein